MLETFIRIQNRVDEIRALIGDIPTPAVKNLATAQNLPLNSSPNTSKEEFGTQLNRIQQWVNGEGALNADGVVPLRKSLPPGLSGSLAPTTLPLATRVRSDVSAETIPLDADESARRAQYLPFIREASVQSGLPEALIAAVIQAESSFKPGTVSRAGAMGLMQLMPENVRELGVSNAFDPRQNILAGARHLRDQVNQFGTLEKSLAAYNAGPGNVKRYGGIPPFPETENYIRRITNLLQKAGALQDAG